MLLHFNPFLYNILLFLFTAVLFSILKLFCEIVVLTLNQTQRSLNELFTLSPFRKA